MTKEINEGQKPKTVFPFKAQMKTVIKSELYKAYDPGNPYSMVESGFVRKAQVNDVIKSLLNLRDKGLNIKKPERNFIFTEDNLQVTDTLVYDYLSVEQKHSLLQSSLTAELIAIELLVGVKLIAMIKKQCELTAFQDIQMCLGYDKKIRANELVNYLLRPNELYSSRNFCNTNKVTKDVIFRYAITHTAPVMIDNVLGIKYDMLMDEIKPSADILSLSHKFSYFPNDLLGLITAKKAKVTFQVDEPEKTLSIIPYAQVSNREVATEAITISITTLLTDISKPISSSNYVNQSLISFLILWLFINRANLTTLERMKGKELPIISLTTVLNDVFPYATSYYKSMKYALGIK